MKKDLKRTIELPEGYTANVSEDKIMVKGKGKEVVKSFDKGKVVVSINGKNIDLSAKGATKRESRMIGTIEAHLLNMIKGLGEEFVYKLEICNVHFPMNVKVEGDKVVIKSFLGEKVDRMAKILPNVKVEVKGSEVTVSSYDREAAGQTAANIETSAKVVGRDRRIFQDGIFMKQKCGRII
jgi:large subunit ribosomal protein L6